jgi:hypothetical protein
MKGLAGFSSATFGVGPNGFSTGRGAAGFSNTVIAGVSACGV